MPLSGLPLSTRREKVRFPVVRVRQKEAGRSGSVQVFLTMPKPHETARPTIIDQLATRNTCASSTECVDILGIARRTFCQWVKEGNLQAVRIANPYKIDLAYLSEWLRSRRV